MAARKKADVVDDILSEEPVVEEFVVEEPVKDRLPGTYLDDVEKQTRDARRDALESNAVTTDD